MVNKISDSWLVVVRLVVVLAVIGLTGFVVVRLSAITTPVVIATVLGAFASILAALPPVIKALRGQ